MDAERSAAPGPVFVVGYLRSGTSLLLALLNQHPDVSLMYEAHVLGFRPVVGPRTVRRDWAVRLDSWNGALTRHGVDPAGVPRPVTPREAGLLLYQTFAGGAPAWGEKATAYVHDLGSVAEAFPEGRFVVIWRDPGGVYDSIRRAAASERFFGRKASLSSVLITLERFQGGVERLLAEGRAVHRVRYEELTEDPLGTMKALAAFLEVPFVDRMGTLDGADLSALPAGEHHSLVRRTQIVRRRAPEDLPPAASRKIARYRARWARLFPGVLLEDASPTAGDGPGRWELAADRLRDGLVRAREAAVRTVYALTPIPLWETYRRLR